MLLKAVFIFKVHLLSCWGVCCSRQSCTFFPKLNVNYYQTHQTLLNSYQGSSFSRQSGSSWATYSDKTAVIIIRFLNSCRTVTALLCQDVGFCLPLSHSGLCTLERGRERELELEWMRSTASKQWRCHRKSGWVEQHRVKVWGAQVRCCHSCSLFYCSCVWCCDEQKLHEGGQLHWGVPRGIQDG